MQTCLIILSIKLLKKVNSTSISLFSFLLYTEFIDKIIEKNLVFLDDGYLNHSAYSLKTKSFYPRNFFQT